MSGNIFDRIHAFVAKWEGGYVNHKNDPGGATNHGVSLRWLRGTGMDITGDGIINIDDIKAMTPETAKELFLRYFWDYLDLSALPPLVAAAVYDSAVNVGCGQAVKFLQRACNGFAGPSLAMDGRMGAQTRARATNLGSTLNGQIALCARLIAVRDEFYHRLASKPAFPDPRTGKITDYKPFLAGWLNRTGTLMPYLHQLVREGVA